jgi:hypothetical protein
VQGTGNPKKDGGKLASSGPQPVSRQRKTNSKGGGFHIGLMLFSPFSVGKQQGVCPVRELLKRV